MIENSKVQDSAQILAAKKAENIDLTNFLLNIKTRDKDLNEHEIDVRDLISQIYDDSEPGHPVANAKPAEDDDGHIEYKLKLVNKTDERITQ